MINLHRRSLLALAGGLGTVALTPYGHAESGKRLRAGQGARARDLLAGDLNVLREKYPFGARQVALLFPLAAHGPEGLSRRLLEFRNLQPEVQTVILGRLQQDLRDIRR